MRRFTPRPALIGVAAASISPQEAAAHPELTPADRRVRHHGGQAMSTDPEPTKQERRDAARAARIEAEQADAAAGCAAGACARCSPSLGAAAVLVVVAIVVSGGGSDKAKSRPGAAQKATGAIPGQKESAEMLAGIPQSGIYLGNPAAPVRLVEFADLQCPFCREYTLQVLPQLVQDYVRSGKVRMEFRNLSFLGKDSVTAGRARRPRPAQQNKLWNFIDVFYFNQGEENSGYVTPSFLQRIDKAAGVDAAKADAFAASPASLKPLEHGQRARPTSWACSRRRPSSSASAAGADGRCRPTPPTSAPSSRPSTGCWGRREPTGACASSRSSWRSIGLGVAAYLTYVHYEGIKPVCGLGGDCEKVQTSEWSKLAGVPVALLGLLGYAAILATLFVEREEALIAGALSRSRASASAPT